MATKRTRKELQTSEEFEKALREDVSVSAEFDLPNTKTADAYVVEKRLRVALPEASFGVTAYRRGEAAEALLARARIAVSELPSS